MMQPEKLSTVKARGEGERVQHGSEAELLAISPGKTAQMLDISRAQLWKLHSAGKVPNPVYLGRKAARWRVEELRAWVRASCPDRSTWQKMKETRAA